MKNCPSQTNQLLLANGKINTTAFNDVVQSAEAFYGAFQIHFGQGAPYFVVPKLAQRIEVFFDGAAE